jgi:hypothetical protein
MYASLLGISAALHLSVFDQPVETVVFHTLDTILYLGSSPLVPVRYLQEERGQEVLPPALVATPVGFGLNP